MLTLLFRVRWNQLTNIIIHDTVFDVITNTHSLSLELSCSEMYWLYFNRLSRC